MNRIFLVLTCFFLLLTLPVNGEIIFSDNFDETVDWTVAQPTSGAVTCNGTPCATPPPDNWTGYLVGMSHCPGGPGYNTMYISDIEGYPRETTPSTGKALTFWDESCVNFFEDSDAQISKTIAPQSGFYLSYYIKFSPGYQWELTDINAHKLVHARYWDGVASSFANFNTPGNVPIVIPGIKVDHDLGYPRLWYYVAYRCEQNYYCQGTPKYTFDVGTDQDAVIIGNWNTTLGDGNWHLLTFYFKTNTNTGATFNADGEHRFWIDGNLIYETTDIPFSDNGSATTPRREWNWFSIGGNNSNRWITGCSGTDCEQWHAIDNVSAYTQPGEDTTAPTTTASPVSGVYTSPQSITLNCTDDTGCTNTHYCTTAACTPSTPYTSPVNLTVPGLIRYYSVDSATNTETVKETAYTLSATAGASAAAAGSFTWR